MDIKRKSRRQKADDDVYFSENSFTLLIKCALHFTCLENLHWFDIQQHVICIKKLNHKVKVLQTFFPTITIYNVEYNSHIIPYYISICLKNKFSYISRSYVFLSAVTNQVSKDLLYVYIEEKNIFSRQRNDISEALEHVERERERYWWRQKWTKYFNYFFLYSVYIGWEREKNLEQRTIFYCNNCESERDVVTLAKNVSVWLIHKKEVWWSSSFAKNAYSQVQCKKYRWPRISAIAVLCVHIAKSV